MDALKKIHAQEAQAAVIYCRVSSTKQRLEGHGLDSQEHRCRQYAEARGYTVEAVFPDDVSGGGDFLKRPGMVALLAYLEAQKGKPYVVIFDDLKRFARDTEFHIKLRYAIETRGARRECLNFNFEDSPEGRFTETIMAAQGELEREQHRRQVKQKMTARVEKGYWVNCAPVGYRFALDPVHGKLLVRDEPLASIIVEALEGFASGRFASQSEVQRFLASKPEFPKSKDGRLGLTKVKKILERVTYAGYINAPGFGVTLQKGHHEPLISFETHERILTRLNGKPVAPVRKDISEDFPLRGIVLCDDCGEPMTSCWSKGRNKHYPYYLCDTPDCPSTRKSIRRDDVEDGARALLRRLQPAGQFVALARAIITDLWEMRRAEAVSGKRTLGAQIKEIDGQIEKLLDRIVEGNGNATVLAAFEDRVEKLERQKIRLSEQAARIVPPQERLKEVIEPALAFLSSPWKVYENGSLPLKRTVMKLAFTQPLRYHRKEGYRTAGIAFPFAVLEQFQTIECGLVEPRGVEPLTSCMPCKRSPN